MRHVGGSVAPGFEEVRDAVYRAIALRRSNP